MFWVILIIAIVILGVVLSAMEQHYQYNNFSDGFTDEEIEYDYLQRLQEKQEEEDYWLQQRENQGV